MCNSSIHGGPIFDILISFPPPCRCPTVRERSLPGLWSRVVLTYLVSFTVFLMIPESFPDIILPYSWICPLGFCILLATPLPSNQLFIFLPTMPVIPSAISSFLVLNVHKASLFRGFVSWIPHRTDGEQFRFFSLYFLFWLLFSSLKIVKYLSRLWPYGSTPLSHNHSIYI